MFIPLAPNTSVTRRVEEAHEWKSKGSKNLCLVWENWRQGWNADCYNNNFFKTFIYLCLERGQGREKERERNISVWLPHVPPRGPGPKPATRAWALTGNRTSDPLVCRLVLNPLSYTSLGNNNFLIWHFSCNPEVCLILFLISDQFPFFFFFLGFL